MSVSIMAREVVVEDMRGRNRGGARHGCADCSRSRTALCRFKVDPRWGVGRRAIPHQLDPMTGCSRAVWRDGHAMPIGGAVQLVVEGQRRYGENGIQSLDPRS
jgi:hypothetical protein